MSATSCVLSEEQFLCCICLDVFTEPVTIPCGHNFCRKCITQHWDINSVKHQCPMCKKSFKARPELTVNTFISEMAAEFKQSVRRRSSIDSEIQIAKSGEIPCDVCTKYKAHKSCVTCLASYCAVHLEPHLSADSLKKHELIEPVENMEGRMCAKHKKPLELFCSTDQTCVCSHCTVSDHMTHNIISLQNQCEVKKTELQTVQAAIQVMIQERKLKIQQVERFKMHSKQDAESEIAHGVQIYTIIMQNAERGLNELIESIEDRQRRSDEHADGFIKELEQEISALAERISEIQQLSCTQDHFHLLQSFTSLSTAPLCKTWTELNLCSPSYEGTVVEAVTQLEETVSTEKRRLLNEAKLRRVQHYAVDVVLDPNTANPWLMLSDDGKQVWCGSMRMDLSDNSERFSLYANVLAQQSFTSGRFYYEVEVTGKTDWILGVVKGSVDRKGIMPMSPANGYWAVYLRNGNEYLTLSSPVVKLSLSSRPQRVGVYVSYEEGLVSFYDVDAALHLYSFTGCSFTQQLYPLFSPGLYHGGVNSAPLTISPVS